MAKALLHGHLYVALVCLCILFATGSALAQSTPTPITFTSGPDWQVYAANPSGSATTSLGLAQQVCLNYSSPQSCPNGAIVYGNPAGGGWSADLSSISGAFWIWAPKVTGSTTKADLKYYYFSKTLELPGSPTRATLSIAVDDYAKVFVNGNLAGEYGSIISVQQALAAQSALKTIDIKSFLHNGVNTITVFAQNGPNTFNGCNQCRYSQNSAGVVFGGSIEFGSTASLPPEELGFTAAWAGFDNQELRPVPISGAAPKTLVNSLNGFFIVRYIDLVFPGDGLRFNFIRYYNSLDPYSGPLGRGWMHAYNVFLRLGTPLVLKEADGREVSYAPAGDGKYLPVTKGIYDILQQNPDGSFILTRKNHNRLFFSVSGQTDEHSRPERPHAHLPLRSKGTLIQITDPEGRNFTLAYLNNRLIRVTDPVGRTLQYRYTNGQLKFSTSTP